MSLENLRSFLAQRLKFQIGLFILITFTLSWIEEYFITKEGITVNPLRVFILMWTPGLVGMSLSWFFGYRLQDIGFKKGPWQNYLIAYLAPALTAVLILLALVVTGLGEFQLSPKLIEKFGSINNALLKILLVAPTVGAAMGFLSGLGEEIGWRGFLHSKLMASGIKHPFLVTGLIWAVWHWPLILFSNYATSDIPLLSIFLFTVMVTSLSVFMGWLRERSQSVFVPALVHGVHNLWIQAVYPAFLKKGPLDAYFGGESGVFNAVFYFLLAVFIYQKFLRNGRPQSPQEPTDWVGKWFELIGQRGFQTDVTLGSSLPGSTEISQWRKYSHAQFDGIGLIIDHFRSVGFQPPVPELPGKLRGHFFQKLSGIFANLRFIPVFGAKWKALSETPAPATAEGQIVYRVLSVEDTQKIYQSAKKASVSVNSQLLWALDQSLRQEWIEGSGPFYWMIPVNMRGAAKKTVDTSNYASWIWVDTLQVKTPLEIQEQIQKRFASGFHWGAWLALNLGQLIGLKGMGFILDKGQRIQEHWVGTFSNVGSWKLAADPVVIVIPTAPSTPLSAGCVTVNDRMALSLHLHPQLKVTSQQLEQWLNDWIKNASQ